jgi:L-amino acid N-acyltransferase YncA
MPSHGTRANRLENNGMEASSSGVRPASAQDATACVAIYRPCVQNTAISWDIDVPTFGEIAARIGALRVTQNGSLERDDQIIGFADGQPLKRLAAFQRATETGMSTSPITAPAEDASSKAHRAGAADKPSPASPSNGFHRSFGLQDAGRYRRVAWMQIDLLDTGGRTAWADSLIRGRRRKGR